MLRVCVVSDDAEFARSLAQAMAGDDLEAHYATPNGLRCHTGDLIDVAVLDLTHASAGDDDILTLRMHIRGPVIVLTADVRESSVIGPLAAGALGVVLHSSDAATVEAAVRAVDEGGLFLDPAMGTTLTQLVTLAARGERQTDLTRTELRVLRHLSLGMTNARIAEKMEVSVNTIKTHVRHILSKLDCDDRVQAVEVAEACGLLP